MKPLTLDPDALVVESFPIASASALAIRPTTTGGTGMNTNEPGCTLPELCGTTEMA
jgi:hypothetical protein